MRYATCYSYLGRSTTMTTIRFIAIFASIIAIACGNDSASIDDLSQSDAGVTSTGGQSSAPVSGLRATGGQTSALGSGLQGTGGQTSAPGSGLQGTGGQTSAPGSGLQGTGGGTSTGTIHAMSCLDVSTVG